MDSPQSVLYVITKATWGGAQRYLWDLMTRARDYGYAPALAFGERGLLAARAADAGFPHYEIPSLGRDIAPLKEWRAKRDLDRLFREVEPDVVHLNSSKAGFTGALAARSANVPRTLFTAHGWAFTEPRHELARRAFAHLQGYAVRNTDATIAVSRFVATTAELFGFPKDRVHTIPLGIEELRYLSREEARAALIEADPSLANAPGLWVGTIAELHPNKGIDIAIDAWRLARPDAHWVVVGGGEERASLSRRAAGDDRIHFLGFKEDAWKYLKAFDLFLLSSRTEALGYVVLEAGAAGVPVIASDAGGSKEALPGRESLFRAGDAPALAERLRFFLSDPARLPEQGAAVRAFQQERFSFSDMLRDTFALYAKP